MAANVGLKWIGWRMAAAGALAAAVFASGRAAAQGSDDPAFDARAQGLDPTPLVIDRLGLTMHYPLGARVTPTITSNRVDVHLRDGADPPAWQMQIQQMVMQNIPDPSPAGVGAELVRTFQRADPATKVLLNESRDLGGKTAHLVIVEAAGEVGGFLIAATGNERYIVFRLVTIPEDYERVISVLNPSFNSVRLSSTAELQMIRESQERRARDLIAHLTPENLRTVVGMSQWYRIYKPDAGGDLMQDTEIGYYHLEVKEGMRGEASPGRDASSYTAGEKEPGLLVLVDARYVPDPTRGLVVDAQIRFWLKWDRTEETWSAVATRRQGEAAITEGEVGVRTPPDLGYSKLKVVKNGAQTRERDQFNYVVQEPYLSQVEVYLLGHLLPRSGSITGEFASHYYETSLDGVQELPLRLDTWLPAQDGSGNWVLHSKPLPDVPPIVATYDRDGRLLRREKADGSVTEPIELRRLVDLWRRKGLPTG